MHDRYLPPKHQGLLTHFTLHDMDESNLMNRKKYLPVLGKAQMLLNPQMGSFKFNILPKGRKKRGELTNVKRATAGKTKVAEKT